MVMVMARHGKLSSQRRVEDRENASSFFDVIGGLRRLQVALNELRSDDGALLASFLGSSMRVCRHRSHWYAVSYGVRQKLLHAAFHVVVNT